jgi:hypothetical protein
MDSDHRIPICKEGNRIEERSDLLVWWEALEGENKMVRPGPVWRSSFHEGTRDTAASVCGHDMVL